MKKLLTIIMALAFTAAKAQDIGAGVLGTISGTALITTYFIKTNNDTQKAVTWNEAHGTQYNESSLKRGYKKENLPFLFVGVGCGIMAVASFTGEVTIFKGRKSKVTASAGGNGMSVAYTFN